MNVCASKLFSKQRTLTRPASSAEDLMTGWPSAVKTRSEWEHSRSFFIFRVLLALALPLIVFMAAISCVFPEV